MSKKFGDRLRLIRGSEPLETYAKALEVSRSTLIRYESGERLPDIGVIYTVLEEHPNVSAQWLLYGDETSGGIPVELPPDERALLENYRRCTKVSQRMLLQTSAMFETTDGQKSGAGVSNKKAK